MRERQRELKTHTHTHRVHLPQWFYWWVVWEAARSHTWQWNLCTLSHCQQCSLEPRLLGPPHSYAQRTATSQSMVLHLERGIFSLFLPIFWFWSNTKLIVVCVGLLHSGLYHTSCIYFLGQSARVSKRERERGWDGMQPLVEWNAASNREKVSIYHER